MGYPRDARVEPRSVTLDDRGATLAAMVIVMMVIVMVMLADDLVVIVVVTVAVALSMTVAMDGHAARTDVDMLREGCDGREGKGRRGGVGEQVALHLDAPRNIVRAATHASRKPIQDYFSSLNVLRGRKPARETIARSLTIAAVARALRPPLQVASYAVQPVSNASVRQHACLTDGTYLSTAEMD